MASGMSTTMRFSAIMLAIGVYGALLSSHSEQLLRASIDPQWQAQVAGIASRVVAGDMPAALNLVPEAARVRLQPLARQAFVDGFSGVLWVAGLLGLLGALVVGRPDAQADTHTELNVGGSKLPPTGITYTPKKAYQNRCWVNRLHQVSSTRSTEHAGRQAHALLQALALRVMQVEYLGGLGLGGQVFVAGLQLVDQLLVEGCNTQPHFPGRHFVDRQLRAIARHEVLEQLVSDVQVFLELLPALLGVFAKHGEGAFVFAGQSALQKSISCFFNRRLTLGNCATTPMEPRSRTVR
jgi:hypothetical protein